MSSQYDTVLEAALSLPSEEQRALAGELLARSEMLMEEARRILATNTKEDDGGPDYGGLIARDKLDLMRPGETIYRFDPPRIDPKVMRKNP